MQRRALSLLSRFLKNPCVQMASAANLRNLTEGSQLAQSSALLGKTVSYTDPATQTVHFPKSCLHCEDPPCVPVCPTGASYKRKSDGIVLVDYDKCIGCKYCAWACPYGARELDEHQKVMKKCTLCVDRIYDQALPEYRLTGTVGPDHRKLFQVEVVVSGEPVASASGASKKEAEQEAARLTLGAGEERATVDPERIAEIDAVARRVLVKRAQRRQLAVDGAWRQPPLHHGRSIGANDLVRLALGPALAAPTAGAAHHHHTDGLVSTGSGEGGVTAGRS